MTIDDALNEYRKNPDLVAANPDVFKETGKIMSAIFDEQRRKDEPRILAQFDSLKPSKYRNQRTEYGGRVYDSKKEAEKARDLDLQVKAGDITFWLYHVRFPLSGGVSYEADFVTFTSRIYSQVQEYYPVTTASNNIRPLDKDDVRWLPVAAWEIEVIETKGFRTEAWRIKEKLFRARYPNLTLRIE